jgi:hypothetical protein
MRKNNRRLTSKVNKFFKAFVLQTIALIYALFLRYKSKVRRFLLYVGRPDCNTNVFSSCFPLCAAP